MGKLIFSMNVSVDGYVDDTQGTLVMGPPSDVLFDYWIQAVRGSAGAIYGRRMYEVMRYWDVDQPEWSEASRAFAVAWRALPKWVVSKTLLSVGPNAELIGGDIEVRVREIKARTEGTISVSGPEIAGFMTRLGLVDAYQLVVRPFVLGGGKAFFREAVGALRFVSSEMLDGETVRLVYAPG